MRIKVCVLLLFLTGCSGLQRSEQENLRRNNTKGECVLRNRDEYHYPIETPAQQIRKRYPWENAFIGKHIKITKEFFRCKGTSTNPPHLDSKDPVHGSPFFDCGGAQKHSLPLNEDKEFIYPILIDLLNFIQAKTDCKAVITCGHRCPVHNIYADNRASNSKHMIGAEVDFYVQGLQQNSQAIVELLMQYYRETPYYRGDKQYEEFKRLDKIDPPLSTPAWFNKEILIKLYKKNEGRDFDNRHPYPYISIQVRHDRERNEKVLCSSQKANTYKRY
jgi:hypothetical protein